MHWFVTVGLFRDTRAMCTDLLLFRVSQGTDLFNIGSFRDAKGYAHWFVIVGSLRGAGAVPQQPSNLLGVVLCFVVVRAWSCLGPGLLVS